MTFRGAARQLDRSIRQLEAQVEELRRQKDEYIRLADDAEGRLGDLALEVSQADAKPPEFSA